MRSAAYVTSFDPRTYRRPLLAKMALPNLKIIYYKKRLLDSNIIMKGVAKLNLAYVSKLEAVIYPHRRSVGDVLISALISDVINKILLAGLRAEVVVGLNPFIASRRVWGDRVVIVDWMDVWMWPWDELNIFDVKVVEEADGVIFWSRPFMELMRRRLRIRKYTYIPIGIDLRDFDPVAKGHPDLFRSKYSLHDSFIVTYSGGVWYPGGVDMQGIRKVVEAAALASRRVGRMRLILQVLGISPELLRLCKELNVKALIMGPLPHSSIERQSLFAATDVFLAPNSRHPVAYYAERIKFFQYMAAAKAIVAEKTPGALSAFGDAAYYVQLDEPEAMADAIVELYENAELRRQLGERARERVVREFDWSVLAPKFREFVLKIAGVS